MILRPATPADAAAIADLGARAFVAKFGHLYSPANLDRFLTDSHVAAKVLHELADPGMAVAVIEDDGAIVAFCKVAFVSGLPPHSSAQRPFELKQLYTDPARTGRGLGARLMDWALDQARAVDADEVQLSVYSDNPEAQRFYARYGMTKIADIVFRVGDHVDAEFMMAVALDR